MDSSLARVSSLNSTQLTAYLYSEIQQASQRKYNTSKWHSLSNLNIPLPSPSQNPVLLLNLPPFQQTVPELGPTKNTSHLFLCSNPTSNLFKNPAGSTCNYLPKYDPPSSLSLCFNHSHQEYLNKLLTSLPASTLPFTIPSQITLLLFLSPPIASHLSEQKPKSFKGLCDLIPLSYSLASFPASPPMVAYLLYLKHMKNITISGPLYL